MRAVWLWLFRLFGGRVWLIATVGGLLTVLIAGSIIWRDDILRSLLDPKTPFQTYKPPPAPNYADARAWALMPKNPRAWTVKDPPADIFFLHPTTYDGGADWNGNFDDPRAERFLRNVVLPNYAGPFARVGRVFAPHYRQASLYAMMTLRDDARDARRFAYEDVRASWRYYLDHYNLDRPVILIGVEQGGVLAARLLAEELVPHPDLLGRLAVAYLIETAVPADAYGPTTPVPACSQRAQAGCIVGYAMALDGDGNHADDIRRRSLFFDAQGQGQLANLDGRAPLCVNPLTGVAGERQASQRLNLGAANATGLEWGVRPAFLQRQVWTQCEGGILRAGKPRSTSLRETGSWSDTQKVPNYNLFYADLEADGRARIDALLARPGFVLPPAPIGGVVNVRSVPIHRID